MEIEIKNTAPLDFNAPWLFFGPLVFNLFEMITLSQMKASTYGDIFQQAALSGNEVKKKKKRLILLNEKQAHPQSSGSLSIRRPISVLAHRSHP